MSIIVYIYKLRFFINKLENVWIRVIVFVFDILLFVLDYVNYIWIIFDKYY